MSSAPTPSSATHTTRTMAAPQALRPPTPNGSSAHSGDEQEPVPAAPKKYRYAVAFPPTAGDRFARLAGAKVGVWRAAFLERNIALDGALLRRAMPVGRDEDVLSKRFCHSGTERDKRGCLDSFREEAPNMLEMLSPPKKMGTTIVVQFQQGCWMYEALNDLHRRLHSALGDYYYPQQNAHFTIGAGNLDPTSELEYNFYNSNPTLVKDLQTKVGNLACKIREGTIGTTLPQQWRNFFEKVAVGESAMFTGPPVSQTDIVRRAMSLFGARGMPAIPTVRFTPALQLRSMVFAIFVDPIASEDVVLDTKTWNEIWDYHIPDMAMKWNVDFEPAFRERERRKKGATLKDFRTYAKREVKDAKFDFESDVVRTVEGGYRLTSIQMYRLVLLCLGQQIKQFKAGSHMNLGFLGPKDGQDYEEFSAIFRSDEETTKMRDGVEEALKAHRQRWAVHDSESGKEIVYLTDKQARNAGTAEGQDLPTGFHLLKKDPGAKMTAFFYFENSLHAAQSVNLLADPKQEFFSACPTSLRPTSDDDATSNDPQHPISTPDLRDEEEGKRWSVSWRCGLKLSAQTIFKKEKDPETGLTVRVLPKYDLDLSDAWKALQEKTSSSIAVARNSRFCIP